MRLVGRKDICKICKISFVSFACRASNPVSYPSIWGIIKESKQTHTHKPIIFIIILPYIRYRNTKYEPNRLSIKISTLQYKKWFHLKLDNTPKNNSIFNTKHTEFSTIRFPLYVSRSFFTNPLNHATIPTFLTNNAFLAWAIFNVPVSSLSTCSQNHLENSHRHYLPLKFSHPANSGCVKYLTSKGVLWGMTLF